MKVEIVKIEARPLMKLMAVGFNRFAVDKEGNIYFHPSISGNWLRYSQERNSIEPLEVSDSFSIGVHELPIGSQLTLTSTN